MKNKIILIVIGMIFTCCLSLALIESGKKTIEILLGILGYILAIVLFWKTDKDLKNVNDQISTRYIANFPDDFYDIIKLIKEAKHTIRIVTDVPGYGIFSSPDLYWEFRNWLQQQRVNKCHIMLIVYDKNQLQISIEEQFRYEKSNLYRLEKTVVFLENLEKKCSDLDGEFWKKYANKIKNKCLASNEELFDLLFDLHESEKKVFRGWQIEIFEKSYKHEVYFWISDNREAIYSILNESPADQEATFYTRDRNFINNYLNINFKKKLEKIKAFAPVRVRNK